MSDERDEGQRGRHSRQPDDGAWRSEQVSPPERFGRGGGATQPPIPAQPPPGVQAGPPAPPPPRPRPSGPPPGSHRGPVPPPPQQSPEPTWQRPARRPEQPDPARGADPAGTGMFVPSWDDDETATQALPPVPPPPRHGASAAGPATGAVGTAGAGAAYGRSPREPDLLTHDELLPQDRFQPGAEHADAGDAAEDPADEDPTVAQAAQGGIGGSRAQRRADKAAAAGGGRGRRFRRVVLAAVLLLFAGPLVAFGVGWLFIDVPSAAALNAQRKQVTTVLYSDGVTEIGRITPDEGNRIEVQLADIPPQVRNAVIATEDRSFYSNPGFDIIGIGRAVWDNLTGGSSGGSTITQQYVKISTGDDAGTLTRKYREVVIASKINQDRSKDQILQDYLNTIYLGRGAYGIQAAAQAYFGKNVQDLTVGESALLAGLIRAPSGGDPAEDPQGAKDRWNFVLDGMVDAGYLPAAERATQVFPATAPPDLPKPGAVSDDRKHILDKVLDELASQGVTEDQLATGGGRIVSTIDLPAQDTAREVVLENLDGQPENLRSALVAVDPETGGVVAYYGGSEGTGFDLAGGPQWSPGSSFKPFTMLAALEQDIGLGSTYPGNSPLDVAGITFRNSESTSYGAITLQEAMTRSVNTTFVKLAQDVGPASVAEAAHQAGIPREINGKPTLVDPQTGDQGLGITLGQYDVRPVDMASAYGTFAADGVRHDPFFVLNYTDADGNTRYEHTSTPIMAFDPEDEERNRQLARNVTASMTGVARYAQLPLAGGRPVAAKTGTAALGETDENQAAWTVGYTPQISTAVWVGDPRNEAIESSSGANIFGKDLPGQIWKEFMDSYLEGKPKEKFPEYEAIGAAGTAEGVVAESTSSTPTSTPTSSSEPSTSTSAPSSPEPPRPGGESDPCASVPAGIPCAGPGASDGDRDEGAGRDPGGGREERPDDDDRGRGGD